MSREDDSPTPAQDEATLSPTGHSGSRWEPREDTGEPREASGDGTAADAESGAATAVPRSRRRGLRIAAGIGATVLLAGGGFAAGHAVGDSGPGGGPDGGPGLSRHHGDRAGEPGRPGQNTTGQNTTGQNTTGSSSPILGGLFT